LRSHLLSEYSDKINLITIQHISLKNNEEKYSKTRNITFRINPSMIEVNVENSYSHTNSLVLNRPKAYMIC